MGQNSQMDPGEFEQKKRDLAALKADLDEAKQKISAIPRADTIRCLYDRLWDFGQAQFAFFYDGFRPGHKAISLADPDVTVPGKLQILDEILKRIRNDMSLLEHACAGRTSDETHQLLEEADDFAFQWLKLVKSGFLNANPTVLTYFAAKQTITRIIPYANVMIIGLDDSKKESSAKAVVAHEIAHYIYWDDRSASQLGGPGYHKILDEALRELAQANPLVGASIQVLQDWSEEIFADAVGCMLGGALTATFFQGLLQKEKEFWEGGKDYPPAVIRPYIYLQVLKDLDGQNQNFVKKQGEEWQQHVTNKDAKRPEEERGTVSILENDTVRHASLATMKELLETVTEMIQEKVFVPALKISSPPSFDASVPLNDFSEQDAHSRNQAIKQLSTPALQPLDPECVTSDLGHIWRDKVKVLGYLSPGQLAQIPPASDLLDEDTPVRQQPLPLSMEEWRPIYEFVGWTTEGPNNGPK